MSATGAEDHVGIPEQRKFSKLMPSYNSKLADMLGLRYIATGAPIESIDKSLKPGDVALIAELPDGHFVYENKRALPRVLFATSIRQANFDDILTTGIWPDFDTAADRDDLPSDHERSVNAATDISRKRDTAPVRDQHRKFRARYPRNRRRGINLADRACDTLGDGAEQFVADFSTVGRIDRFEPCRSNQKCRHAAGLQPSFDLAGRLYPFENDAALDVRGDAALHAGCDDEAGRLRQFDLRKRAR